MSSTANRSNLRWVVCGLLFLATTINYMDRTALGLVEPMLKHLLGGDQDIALYNRRYSDIVNCFIFAYGVGFLLAGRVVDRVGVKKGYALAIGTWALASLSHVLARSPFGFGMARFALGIGESGNFPSALKATADWFPAEERALATGIFNSGTSAGALIAPLLIPFVAVRYGWQAAFYTTGTLGLVWLVGWLFFPYDRLQPKYGNPAPAVSLTVKTGDLQGACSLARAPGVLPYPREPRMRSGGFTSSGCPSTSMSAFTWTCGTSGHRSSLCTSAPPSAVLPAAGWQASTFVEGTRSGWAEGSPC